MVSQRQWLIRYIEVQKKYDDKIFSILKSASDAAEREIKKYKDKPGIGVQVRVAQLMGARGSIHRVLAFMWRDIGNLVKAGRAESQAEAIEQSFDWDETLLARAITNSDDRDAIRSYLLSSADKNIDALMARIFGTRFTLSQLVYQAQKLSDGWVERIINDALGRGATVSELADDVKGLINPNVKGGPSYAANRLARTEINNAYHAQSIQSAQDKPWVNGMRWRLSNSHPTPDNCNLYADADNGLGNGIWMVDRVPNKPHPQCLCYVVPELVTIAEFNRNWRLGIYDEWMDTNYSSELASTGRQVS